MSREDRLAEAISLIESAISTGEVTITRPVSRESQDAQIVELWNLNWSRVEIGRRLGMGRETVSNRLRRLADLGEVSHG